jgi:hypothetical protein
VKIEVEGRLTAMIELPGGKLAISDCVFVLERVKGIEPSSLAWEAKALPLSYTRMPQSSLAVRRLYAALSAISSVSARH